MRSTVSFAFPAYYGARSGQAANSQAPIPWATAERATSFFYLPSIPHLCSPKEQICIIMKKFKRYTVTSALPYANGPLHIGHIAGAYLPADTYVRFLRLRGEDVVYVGGSDEHGVAITIGAKKGNGRQVKK